MKKAFRHCILLSGLTAAAAAGINKMIFSAAVSKNLLSDEQNLYYNWKFGKIFYTKSGSGTPLLFIHELDTMSCGFEWEKIKEKLNRHHTVYTIDLLGCGRSEKPDFTYTNFLYVLLITDFIKNVVRESCTVISSGNSSSLVLMSSIWQSELFKKLILINPEKLSETYKTPQKKDRYLRFLFQFPLAGTMFYLMIHSRFFIREKLKKNRFYYSSDIQDIDIQIFHEASHLRGSSVKYLFSCLKTNYVRIPVASAIQKVPCPVMILGGYGEPDIRYTISGYKNLNPSIKSQLISYTAHCPHMEEPKLTAGILENCFSA